MNTFDPTPVDVSWPRTIGGLARRRTIALWVLIIAACIPMVDPFVTAFLLPKISLALQMSTTEAALAASLTTLLMAATILPLGVLGDRIGRKRVFVAGMVALIVGQLLCAIAPSTGVFLAGRAVVGIGEAGAYAMSMALLGTMFASHEMGRVLGKMFATVAIVAGVALGVAGAVAATNWRLAFLVFPALGAILLLGSVLTTPESTGLRRRFDLVGTILAGLGLITLIVGLGQAATAGWASVSVIAPIAIGIALLVTLFAYESRILHAGLPMDLLKMPPVAVGLVVIAMANLALGTVTVLLPMVTEKTFGWAPTAYLLIATGVMVGEFIGSLIAGRKNLTPKAGARFMIGGMALIAIGLGIASLATAASPLYLLFVAMLVLGTGVGIGITAGAAIVMARAPKDRLGAAGAIKPVAVQIGSALGLGAMLPIMASFMDDGTDAGNAVAPGTHAFSSTMLIAAAIVLIAAVSAFFVLRRDVAADLEIPDLAPIVATDDEVTGGFVSSELGTLPADLSASATPSADASERTDVLV